MLMAYIYSTLKQSYVINTNDIKIELMWPQGFLSLVLIVLFKLI